MSLKTDLKDLSDILEDLDETKDKLSEADLIDLAARLKPVAKAIKSIDDHVKDHVKLTLKHKEGSIRGVLFKAVLKLVPTHRLNQELLREERPKIHAAYYEDVTDERVSFELR